MEETVKIPLLSRVVKRGRRSESRACRRNGTLKEVGAEGCRQTHTPSRD